MTASRSNQFVSADSGQSIAAEMRRLRSRVIGLFGGTFQQGALRYCAQFAIRCRAGAKAIAKGFFDERECF